VKGSAQDEVSTAHWPVAVLHDAPAAHSAFVVHCFAQSVSSVLQPNGAQRRVVPSTQLPAPLQTCGETVAFEQVVVPQV